MARSQWYKTVRCLPSEFKGQVSYKDGKVVPHGTQGSVRPDFCNGTTCSIEVKNYDIEKNIDGLINNVSSQAIDRQINLPPGMKQRVVIDVRGQNLTPLKEFKIKQGIKNKTNGIINSEQIKFLKDKR